MEVGLAADRRHADAVAVAADALDHAGDEVLHLRMVGPPEAQRVEVGDRPRAHREHVAQDAADAGRRALVGLDVARVVVALHLEDARLAVADVDHPAFSPGPQITHGASVGSFLRWMRLDLYCSARTT